MFGAVPQGRGSWDPGKLSPLAWFRANPAYADLGVPSDVVTLKDQVNSSNNLAGSPVIAPQYLPSGWSGDHDAIDFSGTAGGGPIFSTASGPLSTLGTGTDIPLSVILTGTIDTTSDQGFCQWFDSVGNSTMVCRLDNTGVGVLRCDRTDSGAGSANFTGSAQVVLGVHLRMAWVFKGTTVEIYLNGALDNSGALDVGACNFNSFKLATAPGALNAWDGRMRELLVYARPLSAAEIRAHYLWSLANEGP